MKTVKQYITVDEVYPLYGISDTFYYLEKEVELSGEFYEEYTKTSQAFWDMQNKLAELYHGNK